MDFIKKAVLKNMLTFVTVMLSRVYDDRILTGFGVDSLVNTTPTGPLLLSCAVGMIAIKLMKLYLMTDSSHIKQDTTFSEIFPQEPFTCECF